MLSRKEFFWPISESGQGRQGGDGWFGLEPSLADVNVLVLLRARSRRLARDVELPLQAVKRLTVLQSCERKRAPPVLLVDTLKEVELARLERGVLIDPELKFSASCELGCWCS